MSAWAGWAGAGAGGWGLGCRTLFRHSRRRLTSVIWIRHSMSNNNYNSNEEPCNFQALTRNRYWREHWRNGIVLVLKNPRPIRLIELRIRTTQEENIPENTLAASGLECLYFYHGWYQFEHRKPECHRYHTVAKNKASYIGIDGYKKTQNAVNT